MLERITKMNSVFSQLAAIRLLKDRSAQDLIEYAIMAGFVAVAAGAVLPGITAKIATIFTTVASALSAAGS
jgi:Flp pilus assembly pilin Flp